MINDAEWRALLQDIVEVVTQDVESQSDRLLYVLKRAKRALAEEEHKDAGRTEA